jgi:fructuronate reductase
VVCCDNLPSNGRTVKRVVARLAALVDPALGAHVERDVAFPSTMVDRIVPATTDADRASAATALGMVDRWPVMTEPFAQWVLEDRFPTGRPAWERGGAEFVADVAPHETMKLRMLNGAHSSMAYLGLLDGLRHVADAASDPLYAGFVERFWDEVIPTLPSGAGLDPRAYGLRLMARFRNPALQHKLAQIGMDGSQKLPQRHVATLRARLEAGQPFGHVALALAAFLRFMTGRDLVGQPTPVNDPLGGLFAQRAADAGDDPVRLADALLAIEPVFGALGKEPIVRAAVAGHLAALSAKGVRGAIAAAA